MSKLILEKFKCKEDTSEIGSESPYFMIYVAEARNGHAKSDVKFVRKEAWDNEVDKGDTFVPNMTVSSGMHHDLVIVGMIEEDWDPDLASPVNFIIAAEMKPLDSLLAAVSTGVDDNLAGIVKAQFRTELEKYVANDEILGVKRVKPSAPKVNFTGDDGNYEVTFKFA
jgi:hypothetical protein